MPEPNPRPPSGPPHPASDPSVPPPLPETGDATGGVIPYKNPRALAAYYTGVFSLIPCLGFVLGCVAVPLGIAGLRQHAKHPVIRGTVHAWVGIALGGLSILGHLAVAALLILQSLGRR